MEDQSLLIARINTLEGKLSDVMDTAQGAYNYAKDAHRRMEAWEHTLRDHSKTVGLMDAWRKELERRIAELQAPSITDYERELMTIRSVVSTFIRDLKSKGVFPPA